MSAFLGRRYVTPEGLQKTVSFTGIRSCAPLLAYTTKPHWGSSRLIAPHSVIACVTVEWSVVMGSVDRTAAVD
jgi:hypothetical protein